MGNWLDKTGLTQIKNLLSIKFGTKVDKYTNQPAGKFLQTDQNGNAIWGDPVSAQTIANATEDWLDRNISGGQTVAVDASLLTPGAAADAKATGDLIISSDTLPSESTNKLWIKQTPESEITVPTLDEFNDLIISSDTQPSASANRIWIKHTPESEISVPTMDEFDDLESAVEYKQYDTTLWTQMGISVDTGVSGSNNARISTDFLKKNVIGMVVASGYSCGVMVWTGDDYTGSWNGIGAYSKASTSWLTGEVSFASLSGKSIKLTLKNTAGTNIDVSYASNLLFIMSTDTSLSVEGKAADAKTTGDMLNVKANRQNVFDTNYVSDKVPLEKVYGVKMPENNLVVPAECVNNAYVNFETGGLITNHSNYFATGYLPVTAGKRYKSNKGRNPTWYNSSKIRIGGSSGTGIQDAYATAPENAAYLRFNINKTSDACTNPYDLYCADTDVYDDRITIPNIYIKPWCYGKKINWIGDSMIDGPDFDEVVCEKMGMIKSSEYGINGSTFALAEDGTDPRDAVSERYSTMSDDADIIIVSAGTNDFEYAISPVGTIDDPDDGTSNTTFYGAVKSTCAGLIAKYPHKVICFTTPIQRMQPFVNGAGGTYTADYVNTTQFSKNKYGKTLCDYADIIKEVCGLYSIPVLDMYREGGMCPTLEAQQSCFQKEQDTTHGTSFYYYTHLNVRGQQTAARRVCGWLTQLAYDIDVPE